MNVFKLALSAVILSTVVACSSEPPAPDPLTAALVGEHRSEAHKARDKERHPAETLAF